MNTKDFIPSPNPNALQIYDIVAIERIDEPDGFWWIEARTACGHSIGVTGPEGSKTKWYEVVISTGSGPEYRTVRHYHGGEGSDAERVFKSFLDGLTEFTDTTRTR